ncbi:MAG: MBL fold metallo-hydrolase [Dehalococcoidia bacterium]
MDKAKIIFLGTGTSEGVPRVSCLISKNKKCDVCFDSMKLNSKNRRRNTSILIQHKNKNIIIDAGKTFYDSSINFFPINNVTSIDGLIITHAHADAIGGLDDLRDWTNNSQKNIEVFIRKIDYSAVDKMFFYLTKKKYFSKGGVAKLNFNIINSNTFDVSKISFTPIPVMHGKSNKIFGYKFGNTAYISDVSKIPESSKYLLNNLDLLIIDALRPERTHGTHFTLEEAIEQIKIHKPKKALLTNATHDINHHEVNNKLKELKNINIPISYAYDGLVEEISI